jgi:peptidoglycan/xylan/chitin deacetylase (PgdA/CDA1 family)
MISNIPILLYHHVVADAEGSDLAPFIINESDFIWQLDVLKNLGYTTITLQELSTTRDFEKKIILTFDDCPQNLLQYALPHLEKNKLKAVFFAAYTHLGGYNAWNVKKGKTKMTLMTPDEVKHLANLGHEIGAHSMTHPHLHTCTADEVAYEIGESKIKLEKLLNRPILSFAYPYGDYPANYRKVLPHYGYKWAVSMYSRAKTIIEDPYCIRRTIIEYGETPVSFGRKLSGKYNEERVMVDTLLLNQKGLL